MIERSRTLEQIQSTDWGRAHLATIRVPRGETPHSAATKGLDPVFDMGLKAVARQAGHRSGRLPDEIVACFLPSETVEASSEIFDDGSALVRISDSTMTLSWLLAGLGALWSRAVGRSGHAVVNRALLSGHRPPDAQALHPTVRGGATAIRYYIHHQRTWGLSAIIGTQAAASKVRFRDGMLAAVFIAAHEISHVALGHDSRVPVGKDARLAWEKQADHLALTSLLNYFGPVASAILGAATLSALRMIDIWDRGAFIRPPAGHPSTLERWSALAPLLGGAAKTAALQTYGADQMVQHAVALDSALPADAWQTMLSSTAFDTGVHSPGYYEVIRGLDMDLDRDADLRDPLIRQMAASQPLVVKGWDTLRNDGLSAALQVWDAAAEPLSHPDAPLSFVSVVDRLISSPAWRGTSDLTGRCLATLIINTALPELEGAVHG